MTQPSHTDLLRGNWVDRSLPARIRPFVRLARLDRPIGIWLLLLPCLWGLTLAGSFDPKTWALFLGGAIAMRGAGCTLNDLFDRKIDAEVERTRGRPLPSGEVSVRAALLFLVLQLAIALAVLVQFQPMAIALGAASLVVVGIYPLMKRIIDWPQLVLGFAFNWGALLGWTVAIGTLFGPSLWLYAAGIFWTLLYDTIYAHQDRRDDAIVGIRSTARRFGRYSKPILTFCALAMTYCALRAAAEAGLSRWCEIGLFVALGQTSWLLQRWRPDDPADCLRRFQQSRWTGVLTLAALALGRLYVA